MLFLLVACGGDAAPDGEPLHDASAGSPGASRDVGDDARVAPEVPSNVPPAKVISYDMLTESACMMAGGTCVEGGTCKDQGGGRVAGLTCPIRSGHGYECCRPKEPCGDSNAATCCAQVRSPESKTGKASVGFGLYCDRGYASCATIDELDGYSTNVDCRTPSFTVEPAKSATDSKWPGAIAVEDAARWACDQAGGDFRGANGPCTTEGGTPILLSKYTCCLPRGACIPAKPDTECCSTTSGTKFGKECVDGRSVCSERHEEVPIGACAKK